MKKLINKFKEFEIINEANKIENIPLKGYEASILISRIEELMNIMPDRIKIGVPADNKGYTLTYRDANGAIQKIKDLDHYYSNKEEIRFYCWNISYSGSWEATKSLKDKIEDFGGFGKDTNMNLNKIIKYFSENREDVDNVRSISISIDSKSIRKESKNMKEDDYYPQPDIEKLTTDNENTENQEK